MKHLSAALLLIISSLSYAQERDSSQLSERLDPTLQTGITMESDQYASYPFLNLEANTINMNGADWSSLREHYAAAAAGEAQFNVVYLGDSHIQADFGGSVLRSRLSQDAGSAGRGLLIPFRLAGTNQPVDYTITASGNYNSARLLKQPWETAMTFTGIGIQPVSEPIRFEISSEQPFRSLRLMGCGDSSAIRSAECLASTAIIGDMVLCDTLVNQMSVEVAAPTGTSIGGFVLENGTPGVTVHSIGNNGATYGSYATLEGFGPGISALAPDLYIVALGTNEAFGRFDSNELKDYARSLISCLRSHSPSARIMLVTPTECMKKRRTGRRRNRRTRLVVNQNAELARDAVMEVAAAEGIPVYDMFSLAGGRGAAARMQNAGILGRDGVHFTADGYRMWGHLLAGALLNELKK